MEEPSEEHGEPAETYRYEDLSREAQHVFDEARQNGLYFTQSQSLRAEEFQYRGISSYHIITYQNETRHCRLPINGEANLARFGTVSHSKGALSFVQYPHSSIAIHRSCI